MKSSRSYSFPYLIAGFSLVITIFCWYLTARSVDLYNTTRFRTFSDSINDEIEFRMQTYINTLNQTKGMFAVTPYLTRSAFKEYVKNLDVSNANRGLQGLGEIERIKSINLKSHVAQARSEGFPDYKVWPSQKKQEYFSIINIEPMNDRYRKLIGFDMSTEPNRKAAMDMARDTGLPVSTNRITPVLDTTNTDRAAFIIFVPLYKFRSDVSNVEDRRKNLVGFLYSPFIAAPLFGETLLSIKSKQPIDFEVYIGDEMNEQNLVYDGDQNPSFRNLHFVPTFQKKFKMKIAGKTWTVFTYSLPGFINNSFLWIPWLVFFIGLLVSGLLFKIMLNYWTNSELEKIRATELEELNQKAQDAVASRDEFLSIASHELKTPLTSLKLQIQLVIRQFEKGSMTALSPEKITKMGVVCDQQLRRLTDLVDNLLDVSRARAGKLQLRLEELNVTEVIQSTVEKFKVQGITNNTIIDFNSPEIIVGLFDRVRIEQITENLLSNAAKYAPGKPVSVKLYRDNSKIKFEVQDQGMGISLENQSKIFERFERVSENSKGVGGLGLGLFITKQIIDAHGGTIKVDSKVGEGAKFTVELPIEV